MHIMVDLETLDTKSTAVVVSIGAVLFDPYDTSKPMQPIYSVLDIQSQINDGRTISGSTISWWMKQSEEARNVFTQNAVPVSRGLSEFNRAAECAQGVWGNGSDFDNAILASLNETVFRTPGWNYSRNRCFRTIKNLGKTRDFVEPLRKGTHHNALDDAIYQAEYLQAIVKALGIRI